MAAETETSEGVVFKSEDDAILLKDAKGEPWKSYLKYGRNYDSYKPPVGQKVRVHYRAWENPTTSKVSYYLNEVEVLGPPPDTEHMTSRQPSPAGPGPAVTYQATQDAAQARVAYDPAGGVETYQDAGVPGQARVAGVLEPGGVEVYVDVPAPEPGGFPKPELGSWASKELSIEGQNRLNVSIKALVANLEQCPEEQKAGRFITPDLILMFVQGLEQGGSEPPPEDLPG